MGLSRLSLLLLLSVPTVFGVACGARSQLFVDPIETDASFPKDAGRDVTDARDTSPDVLPPIDARPNPDAAKVGCPEGNVTYVYLITTNYELYSFYPPTLQFRLVGQIACPNQGSSTPFSMAVDRKGVAYIVYNDGRLFRVSTLTASCLATTYAKDQLGITTFGMGFAASDDGTSESLYVATSDNVDKFLGTIDTSTYQMRKVGDFNPPIGRAELTGTGSGGLYGFYEYDDGTTYIGQIDKASGRVTGESLMPGVKQGQGWAFAFWGGDFYMFTAPSGQSLVTRYRPSDRSTTLVARLSSIIVGAGVSTCAPEQ